MVEESSNTGIVYILSNAAMEGYIKIGMTNGNSPKDVQNRMKQLDSTGVPRAFNCEYVAVVADYERVEQALHIAFGDFRVRETREFFERLAPSRAEAVLRLLEIKDVTPVAEESSEEEKQPMRPPFRFSMVGVPVGAALQWANDPEIECTVVDDKRVLYDGTTYSLSGLAQKLKPSKRSVAGPMYWMYEEETLAERRWRFEAEDDDEE